MIRDGLPYPLILKKLGRKGKSLNRFNLMRWTKTGFQVWLAQQIRREDACALLQFTMSLGELVDPNKLHSAAIQIAASRIAQVLLDCDPIPLKQKVDSDPHHFLLLLQALPKLTHAAIACERKREGN
jgi:hypothetical protein